MVFGVAVLASGCVRRTISSRPGWKDPKTGKLLTITSAHQKIEEERTIWIWQPEFYKTRKEFKQAASDETY